MAKRPHVYIVGARIPWRDRYVHVYRVYVGETWAYTGFDLESARDYASTQRLSAYIWRNGNTCKQNWN